MWNTRVIRGEVMTPCPACGAALPDGARFCPACGTPLAAAGRPAVERKVVSTLFADLVGFTALGERHDPEDVDAALRAFFDLARGVVERFGGGVEKYIGDAVVGLFGVPLAHEDDAERAVRAALELVARMHELPPVGDERLEVRTAVTTGPALVRLNVLPHSGEGMLVGDAVNTAARLLAAAAAMSVVVGATTHRLTARVINYEQLPAITAKGKARPVDRWVARGPVARRGVDPVRDQTRMVGREVELAVLSGLLDRALASTSPQFALITGEAGIGKSRLVRELFRTVDERPGFMGTWRQGSCPAYGDGLAYWALREIVSAHAGILRGDTPSAVEAKLAGAVPESDHRAWLLERLRPLVGLHAVQAGRDETFAAWTTFIEDVARTRPAVMVFEDLHWASDPTLAYLKHLVLNAAGVPLLVIGTARTEFLEAHPDAARYTHDLEHVPLEPLTEGESARLVHALPAASEVPELEAMAVAHCGGNPLYAEELIRYGLERGGSGQPGTGERPMPDSLVAIVGARLDALPPAHKALLADAAVIGEVFWPGPLAAVRGTGVDEVDAVLERLTQRGLVRESAESVLAGERELAFSHSLVREVAYTGLPRAERARKHAAAAEWLAPQEQSGADFAEIVAYHYFTSLELALSAGEKDLAERTARPAAQALARAGDAALALDLRAAERHYAHALASVPADDPARPRMLAGWALAQAQSGSMHAAVDAFTEAIAGLEDLGDARAAAVAMTELSRVLVELSDPRAAGLCEAALDAIADDVPSAELVRVLEQRAYLHLTEGDSRSALDAADRALSVAHLLGLPESPRALMQRGVSLCDTGDAARALRDLRQALARALADGVAAEVSGAYACLAEAVLAFEGPARALAIHRDGLAVARSRHDEIGEGFLRGGEFEDLVVLGRWEEALGSCDELEAWFHARDQAYDLWSLGLPQGDRPRAARRRVGEGRGTWTRARRTQPGPGERQARADGDCRRPSRGGRR